MQIVVRLQAEGFHCWPDAPDFVDFLRQRHRHVFHIECRKNVADHDREIEIIEFKRQVSCWMADRYGRPMELGAYSCEQLAHELLVECGLAQCMVLEDGENGAVAVH